MTKPCSLFDSTKIAIKSTVVVMLTKLMDENSELCGFGEYGRGWNDKSKSMDIRLREELKRWE